MASDHERHPVFDDEFPFLDGDFFDLFIIADIPSVNSTYIHSDPIRMRATGPVLLNSELATEPFEYEQEGTVDVFDDRNPKAIAGTLEQARLIVPPPSVSQ